MLQAQGGMAGAQISKYISLGLRIGCWFIEDMGQTNRMNRFSVGAEQLKKLGQGSGDKAGAGEEADVADKDLTPEAANR